MTPHLTSRQTSEWLAGFRSPEMDRHLAECAECRAAIRQFESVMNAFRQVVHGRSEQHLSPDFVWTPPTGAARFRAGFRSFYPAFAAAVVMILLAVALLVPLRPHASGQEMASTDSALLQQVDNEISRSVPEPMEPLMLLVNRDAERETRAKTVSRND